MKPLASHSNSVRGRSSAFAMLVLLVSSSCESPVEHRINPAPEHVSARVQLNKEVRGESLDEPGDVDEFEFDATDDGSYDVFVQSAKVIRVEVLTDSLVASATNQAGDTSLFAHHTGVIQVVHAAPYVIRVTAANTLDSTTVGPYRLFIDALDHRPEHIDSIIGPGDTISGEELDRPTDVDEFVFSGTAGDEYNLFFHAQSGSSGTYLVADVQDPDGSALGQATSLGTDTSLDQVSGRFAIRTTGRQRLRILAAYPANQGNLGPYRFFLYRINRQPETRPNTLAFGDSLSGEAIELPGDVDEFRVNVPAASGANLVVQLDCSALGTGLLASLVSSTNQTVAEARTFGAGSVEQSGRVQVTAGNYILRADGNGEIPMIAGRAPPRGRYKLWLYRFSTSPEAVSAALTIPDTVNESINPPGDEDVFRFNGTRRAHINIALQGMAGATANGGFRAFLMLNGNFPVAFVSSPTASPSLGSQQTLRLDLPATAPYTISVTGASSPEQLYEIGPYRLAVTPVPTSPEHAGSALAPGDSVTTEMIDSPGDWDEFTLPAVPGTELGLFFASEATTYYPWILVSHPVTGDSLAGTVGQGRRFAGPFKVPSSGQVSVAVFERPNTPGLRECYDATCGGVFQYTGAYQFNIVSINRAPETRSAVYLTGDTVRGEAIDPSGDIDEFTAQTVSGLVLTPYVRLTADPVNGTGLTFEIIDPATGSPLSGNGAQFIGATAAFNALPPFTVPSSGNYIIRIRGSGIFGDEFATAPYEFVVKP